MAPRLEAILSSVSEVASGLHGAGAISPQALAAIARRAGTERIRHSAETGSGASTLLLSHWRSDHTVFALDSGDSISNVRRSPLLRWETVTFIEGQFTLPRHRFVEELQFVLLDGPHGDPFPGL